MPTEESEAPVFAPSVDPSPLAALIDAWFVERFHGAPAMRDTEAFNHAQAAKEDLKRRLAGE